MTDKQMNREPHADVQKQRTYHLSGCDEAVGDLHRLDVIEAGFLAPEEELFLLGQPRVRLEAVVVCVKGISVWRRMCWWTGRIGYSAEW